MEFVELLDLWGKGFNDLFRFLVDGLDAAVPFYGIAELGDPAQAKTPLKLHFGTNGIYL